MKAYRSILPRPHTYLCHQRSNRAIHVSDRGFRFPCKILCRPNTSSQNLPRKQSFLKQKQARKATIAQLNNSISGPKKNVHLQQRTRRFSRNRFTLSVTSHFQLRAAGDRHRLMNSKQNGGKDQQVSMIFVQPSRFSLRNQLCEKENRKH